MTDLLTLPAQNDLWQASLQWQPTPELAAQFSQLYDEILVGNRQLNLTRLTEPDDFWEKHLWDAIAGILPLKNYLDDFTGYAVDVGTGGGIPGLPLAFLHPELQVILLDSTQKKIRFLQELADSMAWQNVGAIATRAEAMGRNPRYREQFQIALIRAVAPPVVCAEYVLPLLELGGVAVLYQGQWNSDDSQNLEPVLELLGGELLDVVGAMTPLTQTQRHWIYLRKVNLTPNRYPRAIGIPSKRPLSG